MKGLARMGYEKAKGSAYRKDIIKAQLRGEDIRAGEGRPLKRRINGLSSKRTR